MTLHVCPPTMRGALCAVPMLLALWATPASAQDTPAPSLPAPHTLGSVQYRCGGIGSDESQALRAAMPQHKLSLLMARSDGAYLADVAIRLEGANVAAHFTADGPVCLLDLPDGTYTLTATAPDGQTQRHQLQVGAPGQVVQLRY